MTQLVSLHQYPYSEDFLSKEKWGATDYYELCCHSELWGCAFLVTLDKSVAYNPNEAFVFILTRMAIEGESWNEELQKDITAQQMVDFALGAGYLAAASGSNISLQEFRKNYVEIRNGIESGKEFVLTRNGVETEKKDLIRLDDVLSVICFVNEWNSRQYFAETRDKWLFFSWGTGA